MENQPKNFQVAEGTIGKVMDGQSAGSEALQILRVRCHDVCSVKFGAGMMGREAFSVALQWST